MSDQDPYRLTHEEILERLPAFVVGALDPDEMLAVEEYVETHPELVPRLHELEAATARLAYAAPWQPLSQDVQAKVMNRARASLPQRTQGVHTARPAPPSPRPVQPAARRGPFAGVVAWWRRRGFSDLALVAAVAAAIVMGVFLQRTLVEVDGLQRQIQGLEQQVATIQAENSAIRTQNLQLQIELEAREGQLASLAGATGMVALGGTDAAPQASGTLYVREGEGTLVLSNLEALSPDQIYQLWLIPPDGAPIPAGLLGQAGAPVETITLPLPTTLDRVAAVGISIEPPGGSAAPTGPIVLLGERA